MINEIKKSLFLFFISGAFTTITSPFLIHLMYKLNQVSLHKETKLGSFSGTNKTFLKIMKVSQNNGTPNMGGIIIWIAVPILSWLFLPHTNLLKIFLLAFIIFGAWGLLDVVFTNAIQHNARLKALQETFEWRVGKATLTLLLSLGLLILLKNFTIFYIANTFLLPISILGLFSIYTFEITDGLDGLMIGISMIIYATFAFLLILQGNFFFLPIIGIILGTLTVDLYFNIPPARFWNGGPSAMPLGFSIFFMALITNNLLPYFIMSSVTWVILGSSTLQLISMKFFNRRIFKIAPLHHHFQAKGWPDTKVTMRFWLYTFVSCILGILVALL